MAADGTDDLEAISALLPRLLASFQRAAARDLAGYGLTFPQFLTLRVLDQAGGQCSMGSLAAAVMQSAAAMTGIVDRLLARDLVTRERYPQDRRSVVVRLTDHGRALLAEAHGNRRRQEQRLLGSLSPEERRCIRAVLSKMVEAVEAGEETP